jgi:hypothetical protein
VPSPRLRKLLLWLLGVVIGLVVLLTVAVLIAERLIDTPKLRAQLTGKLSELLNGQVAWKELKVRLLPLPHGVIRGVHVAIPNLATADVAMADVKIRLLPLFHGSAEVQTITVEHPNVEVWISASTAQAEAQEKSSGPTNPLALYRSAMRPILDAVARFAPHTTVAIEDGRVAVHLFKLPPFETSKLELKMITDDNGVAVNASATGTYWDRVAIDGRVEFGDLRALVKLEGAGLKPQPALEEIFTDLRKSLMLSEVGATFEARTDGHTDIGIALGLDLPKAAIRRGNKELDIAQVRLAGSIRFIEEDILVALDQVQLGELAPTATVDLLLTGPKRAPKLDVAIGELDLSRLRDAAMTLAGDQPAVKNYISRIHGGRLRDLRFSTQAQGFAELFSLSSLHLSAQLADGSVQVPTLEREATKIAARAELVSGVLKVGDVGARLGASQLRQAGVDIVLLKPMRMERARGQATIVLHDLLPGLRAREPFARLMRSLPTLTGIAEANVRSVAFRFDEPSRISYDLAVSPQHIRIQTDQLPEAVDVNGGAVRVASKSISVDRVGIAVLNSTVTVSGEVTDFQRGKPRVTASIADGVAERKLIDWIWQRAALAERFEPATPLRFGVPRAQWTQAGLDVVAEGNINAGPSLSIDLSMRDKTLTVRRATIKDHDSDATLAFAMHDSLIQVSFSGKLAARSLAAILGRSPENYLGSVRGDIQATLDLVRRGRSAAQGRFAGERIDLRDLVGLPLKLERFEMQGEGSALQIGELTMDWAEQTATVRGKVAREGGELAATLEIDSPGIVIDALRGTPTTEAVSAPSKAVSVPPDKPGKPSTPFDPWSLPLRGSVSLRTDFVEYRGYRVQGIRAVATLEHETAALKVTEASLCGISFPLSLRVTPTQFDANVNVAAKDQSLEGVTQCLAGQSVIITGNFSLTSVLTATGPTSHTGESLAKDIGGSVKFSSQNGEIREMALLGKILSLKSVRDLLKGDVGLGGNGFKYRSISLGANIEKGEVTLEPSALDSPALGVVATGTIDLADYDSHLTVLVAPFGKLDSMVRKIPILGYVVGGAFTSVPVSVKGDIRKPIVAPLGPEAVGSEVLGVFQRTFKLPGKMIEPFSTKPSK